MSDKRILLNVLAVYFLTMTFSVNGSELVYKPINPSFGGSSLNGTYLLSNAQSQDSTEDPDRAGYTPPTSLDRLVSSLQSRLISQLLADVGPGSTGFITTDEFQLEITEGIDGTLTVTIIDLLTNDSTQIQVNGLVPD